MRVFDWWQRLGGFRARLPPRLVTAGTDVALAVLAAAGNVVRIAVSGHDLPDPPDALGYILGVVMAAGLVARRRYPVATLLWVWVCWTTYHVLDYPGGAPAVAVWVALYSAAAAERRRGFAPAVAAVLASDILGRAQSGSVVFLSTTLDSSSVAWIAVLLLGDAVRSRRRLHAEQQARLAQVVAEQEHEAARRVAGERLRIARELHDVTAHTISVVAVQSEVAAETLDEDPGRARAALGAIRTASREALDELNATVGMLRQPDAAHPGGDAALGPMPGLDQLDDLVGMATGSGVRVRVAVDGQPRRLPAAVDLTAYRVVQESVTNVLRHAGAATATVRVGYQPDGVLLEIDDDGAGPPGAAAPARPPGYGLAGMRERVTAVGGTVDHGRGPRGGFRVRVWLPTQRAPA